MFKSEGKKEMVRNFVNFELCCCEASVVCCATLGSRKIKFTQVEDSTTRVPLMGVVRLKLKPKDYYLLSEVCLSFNGKMGHFMCIIIVLKTPGQKSYLKKYVKFYCLKSFWSLKPESLNSSVCPSKNGHKKYVKLPWNSVIIFHTVFF